MPVFVFTFCLFLTTCAAPSRAPVVFDSPDGTLAAAVSPLTVRQAPTARKDILEQVLTEPGMEWLSEPITLALAGREVGAKEAIQAATQGRAVAFDLVDNRNPDVRAGRSQATPADFMDLFVVQADWVWEVESGVVVVRDRLIKTLNVAVMPGTRTFATGIDGLSNGQGGGNGSNNYLGLNNPYEALRSAIQALGFVDAAPSQQAASFIPEALPALIDSRGARCQEATYSVMEYTGMVVLNGCPSLVRATEALVKRFNGGHYRRAVAEITVYEIEFTAGSDRSLDLNLLRTTANSLGLSIAPATSAGSGGLRFDVRREGDRLLGSRATLNWLQQQGQTSTRLHRRVELKHNELSTIRDVAILPYVREVTLTNQSIGASTNVTPSVRIEDALTGYVLNILPTIPMGDNRVSMRMNLSRARKTGDLDYSFGDGAVSGSVPELAQQDDVVTVSLASGEASIVSSAALVDSRSSNNRTPFLPVAGDSVSEAESQREFVMLVSVVIE